MSFPGAIPIESRNRLLPPSVPFRFFVAAAVFHVAAWGLLAVGADQVPGFAGGPGPVLAAVHALTLGVLAMTVIGASVQLLPVVTGRPPIAVWPIRLLSWLYLPGVAVTVYGFAMGELYSMAAGAAIGIVALLVFAALVGDILRRTVGMTLLVLHGWASLASLVGLMALGLSLILDLEYGFIADRQGINVAHMVLAVYGFLGMAVIGYGHVLVPMFALSAAPGVVEGSIPLILSLAALGLGAGGAAAGADGALVLAAGLAVVAAALHVRTMLGVLQRGMRKRLGMSFVLVKAAWGLLPVGLVVGGLAAAGLLGDKGAVLFGFLALFGWLLTFVLGILQRIVPFLAAMNAAGDGRPPPLLSRLTPHRLLGFHAVCHFTALALVSLGIALGQGSVVLAGALAGLAGSLAFLWFGLEVIRRMLDARSRPIDDGVNDHAASEP